MPPASTMNRCFHPSTAPSLGARSTFEDYPGDASGEAPPVPIPNTEVKLSSAEDTRGATPWENRSSPGYSLRQPRRFHRRGCWYPAGRGSRLPAARAPGRSPYGDRRRRRRAPVPRRGASRPARPTAAGTGLPDRCARAVRSLPRVRDPQRRRAARAARASSMASCRRAWSWRPSRRGAASPGGAPRADRARWPGDRRGRRCARHRWQSRWPPASWIGDALGCAGPTSAPTRPRRPSATPSPTPTAAPTADPTPPRRQRQLPAHRPPRSRRRSRPSRPRAPRTAAAAAAADVHRPAGRHAAARSRSASGRRSPHCRRRTGSRIRTRSSSARCW